MLYYAPTTEMWSSRTTDPYMSLMIHFIPDWTLCSRCLQTSYFPDDHTGEITARGLREALELWGLRGDHLVCGHRLHLAIGECLKQCKNVFQQE